MISTSSAEHARRLYGLRKSQAAQARESGNIAESARLYRLAQKHLYRAERQEWYDEHYGVFVGMPTMILEPGDKGW